MKLVILCLGLLLSAVAAREDLSALLLQLKRALGADVGQAQAQICGFKGDVVFLMDASSSINEEDYTKAKNFVKDTISEFDVGPDKVRVGVAAFNNEVQVAFHLNKITEDGQTPESLMNLVDTTASIDTGTLTHKGLAKINEEMLTEDQGERPDVPNVIITITDGKSRNSTKTFQEVQKLRDNGAIMFAVGVGKWRSEDELQMLSSKGDFMFSVDDFDGLETIISVLSKKTCEVLEKPPQMITECDATADLLFVIDGSSSIKEEDFQTAKNFVASMLDGFIISPEYLQVAVLTFDQTPRRGFYFNEYKTVADIKAAVMDLQQYDVGTFTNRALKMARMEYFNPINGAREDVPSIILLLSDGKSRKPELTLEQAAITKDFDIKIMTVGIGKQKVDELEAIASLDQNTQQPMSFPVDDFDQLMNITNGLVDQTCKETPVVVKKCEMKVDVMFVLDLSSSVGTDKPLIQDFITKMSSGFEFGENAGRMGFITFNRKSYLDLKLSDGVNREAVIAAVENMRETDTGTMTWKALDMLRDEAFLPENGGRPDAKKLVFILSDGKSRDMAKTISSAQLMKAAQIKPFVLTVGKFKEEEINAMAGKPADFFTFSVDDFKDLFSLLKVLKKRGCSEPPQPSEKRQLLSDLEALIALEEKLKDVV